MLLLFVMVLLTTNTMDNHDEAVTVLVGENNIIYQLIGVISDSSDDSNDNLPFLHRVMPRTKQTGRKIPGAGSATVCS